MKQLSFADMQISQSRKPSRISKKLDIINGIVDWEQVYQLVKVVDYTDKKRGGAPHKDLLMKTKMIFLQHLYNLSDPELEDQVNDRLSFQRFVGVDYSSTIPDYTTIVGMSAVINNAGTSMREVSSYSNTIYSDSTKVYLGGSPGGDFATQSCSIIIFYT